MARRPAWTAWRSRRRWSAGRPGAGVRTSAPRPRSRPCPAGRSSGSPYSATTVFSEVEPVQPATCVVAGRARHVDAPPDRVDPGRAGVGHHDARGAEDREPAEDAQARVPRGTCDLLAVVHRDRDLDVAGDRRAPPPLARCGRASSARGTGLIAGSPTSSGRPGRVTVPTPGPARKTHPGARAAAPYGGPHQRAVRDVRVVARVLDHAGRRPVASVSSSTASAKAGVWPLGRVMVTGSGNSPVSSAVYAAVVAAVAQAPVVHPRPQTGVLELGVARPLGLTGSWMLHQHGAGSMRCTCCPRRHHRGPRAWPSPAGGATGSGDGSLAGRVADPALPAGRGARRRLRRRGRAGRVAAGTSRWTRSSTPPILSPSTISFNAAMPPPHRRSPARAAAAGLGPGRGRTTGTWCPTCPRRPRRCPLGRAGLPHHRAQRVSAFVAAGRLWFLVRSVDPPDGAPPDADGAARPGAVHPWRTSVELMRRHRIDVARHQGQRWRRRPRRS